jgi:oligoendopeptidase F
MEEQADQKTHTPGISEHYTWNLESIFANEAAWEEALEHVKHGLPSLAECKGRLLDSAETLLNFLTRSSALDELAGKVHTYAYLRYFGNTHDEAAGALLSRAKQLSAELGTAQSFFAPEILQASPEAVRSLVSSDDRLRPFEHLFHTIERDRAHTCSAEVENALEVLSPVQSDPEAIRTALHDAEMTFSPVEIDGASHEVNHGTIDALLAHPERQVREAAYNSYTDAYLRYPQTFAQVLWSQATSSLVFNKVRNFDSTFEAKMFQEAFAPEIFHSVLSACREHRHLFQRYFKARAAILGIPKINEYDLLAPLTTNPTPIPYDSARELVLDALKPLGSEYVHVARRGLYEERWADVYPKAGKYSNAFSGGSYGTRPFLLLNYAPTMAEVGTLAHELGHSMHSHITNTHQPSCYAGYAMSVAETASNLNQVLLRAKVLEGADRDTALSVLEEAFFFAHRYLFLMPTMSEVEHKLHTTCAAGGAMSASELREATVEAFSAAYGDTVEFDPERLGMKWAKFCHFYAPYYFFQYAIGISAAMTIGQRILAQDDGIQEKYLRFLAAGGSDYPAEIFKIVDIDITSPKPYREAFKVVEGYVARLEEIGLSKSIIQS